MSGLSERDVERLDVTEGHGGPGYGHRNVGIVEGSFRPDRVVQR